MTQAGFDVEESTYTVRDDPQQPSLLVGVLKSQN